MHKRDFKDTLPPNNSQEATRQDMQTLRKNLLYIEERYRDLQDENQSLK